MKVNKWVLFVPTYIKKTIYFYMVFSVTFILYSCSDVNPHFVESRTCSTESVYRFQPMPIGKSAIEEVFKKKIPHTDKVKHLPIVY